MDANEYVAFRTAEVNIYDFATDEVTSPWRAALERLDVWAPLESLAEMLPNDELFVEEQPHGRLIRLTLEGDVVWEYVNRAKMGRVFRMAWSRLLDTATGSRLAETLARVDCRGVRFGSAPSASPRREGEEAALSNTRASVRVGNFRKQRAMAWGALGIVLAGAFAAWALGVRERATIVTVKPRKPTKS